MTDMPLHGFTHVLDATSHHLT